MKKSKKVIIICFAVILAAVLAIVWKNYKNEYEIEDGGAYIYPIHFANENVDRNYVIMTETWLERDNSDIGSVSWLSLMWNKGERYCSWNGWTVFEYKGYNIDEYVIIEDNKTHSLKLGKYGEVSNVEEEEAK